MSPALQTHRLRVDRGLPAKVIAYLTLPEVLHQGHFRLLSGRHSAEFIAFSGIARSETALAEVRDWLLPSVAPWDPTAILSPSTAGVSLAAVLAKRLGIPLQLAGADEAGRPDGVLGDADLQNQRVAIVNDVVTTGDGLLALRDLVTSVGANPVGAAWFLSRSDVDIDAMLEMPTASVGTIELKSHAASECPLCAAHVELEDGLDLN